MRFRATAEGQVPFTAAEEAERDHEEAAWPSVVAARQAARATGAIRAKLLDAVLVDDQLAIADLRNQLKGT